MAVTRRSRRTARRIDSRSRDPGEVVPGRGWGMQRYTFANKQMADLVQRYLLFVGFRFERMNSKTIATSAEEKDVKRAVAWARAGAP